MNDEQLPDLEGASGADQPQRPASQAPPPGQPAAGGRGGSKETLAAVMELEVPVSIELGRTHMAVEEVLALGKGSVVQLDRLVGQPVEVYVSNKPFAKGEVVVTGEKFGVRILSIEDPATHHRDGG